MKSRSMRYTFSKLFVTDAVLVLPKLPEVWLLEVSTRGCSNPAIPLTCRRRSVAESVGLSVAGGTEAEADCVVWAIIVPLFVGVTTNSILEPRQRLKILRNVPLSISCSPTVNRTSKLILAQIGSFLEGPALEELADSVGFPPSGTKGDAEGVEGTDGVEGTHGTGSGIFAVSCFKELLVNRSC